MLTENSTCRDYLNASSTAQSTFLQQEVTSHVPQTNASFTMAQPGGSPSLANGNAMANGLMVTFLQGTLKVDCAKQPTARLGAVLAPAWTSQSPSP